MMSFEEYVNRCYSIPYEREAVNCTEFGKPMNCYGFVKFFYQQCLGIELDSFGVSSFDNIHMVQYTKVDVPSDGDVVDIFTTGVAHVGIIMGDLIYHFTREGLVAKNRYHMLKFIKGFYHVHASKN